MSNSRDEIQAWIHEQLECVEEAGPLGILTLLHYNTAGQDNEIHSLSSKQAGAKWEAEKLAEAFDVAASRHARGIMGTQQYALCATFGTAGKPSRTLPFLRAGATHVGPIGLGSEGPSEQGRIMQAQRWGEDIVRLFFGFGERLMLSQQQAVESRDRTIADQRTQLGEMNLALLNLGIQLTDRRHERRLAELREARLNEVQKQALKFLPSILNTIAGNELVPMSTADSQLIDGIVSIFTPDQIQTGLTMLQGHPNGATLATVLANRVADYHKRAEAERVEEQRLMRDSPPRTYEEAEEDAAGNAFRAMTMRPAAAQIAPPKTPEAAARLIAAVTNVTEQPARANGHANGHAAPVVETPDASDAEEIMDGLLDMAKMLPGGDIGMLSGMMRAQGKGDLADKLEAYAARKAK